MSALKRKNGSIKYSLWRLQVRLVSIYISDLLYQILQRGYGSLASSAKCPLLLSSRVARRGCYAAMAQLRVEINAGSSELLRPSWHRRGGYQVRGQQTRQLCAKESGFEGLCLQMSSAWRIGGHMPCYSCFYRFPLQVYSLEEGKFSTAESFFWRQALSLNTTRKQIMFEDYQTNFNAKMELLSFGHIINYRGGEKILQIVLNVFHLD